jgi:hypothetical protein
MGVYPSVVSVSAVTGILCLRSFLFGVWLENKGKDFRMLPIEHGAPLVEVVSPTSGPCTYWEWDWNAHNPVLESDFGLRLYLIASSAHIFSC